MATVTQLIPTLTGGISQQPDELKVPGQVNVADNVLVVRRIHLWIQYPVLGLYWDNFK